MAQCCDPVAYRREFDERGAARRTAAYRRKGLDRTSRTLVDSIVSLGVEGMTVLEVGGGVGQIQIELLEAGAATAVNVELSDGYESAAAELLAERSLGDRVERRLGDFVAQADLLQPADVVVLNRVVCCYPWMEPLIDAATSKTRRLLAISLPRDHRLSRFLVDAENLLHRVRRHGFRAYIHPVAALESRVIAAGLRRVHFSPHLIWQEMVFERPGAPI